MSRIFVVAGEPAVDDLEQLDALHAGHDLVGDHERDRLAVALSSSNSATASSPERAVSIWHSWPKRAPSCCAQHA